MRAQVEVIYENGILRPLGPVPNQLREHKRYLVTVEGPNGEYGWLQGSMPAVSLEEVRTALAKVQGTLAEAVRAEREER